VPSPWRSGVDMKENSCGLRLIVSHSVTEALTLYSLGFSQMLFELSEERELRKPLMSAVTFLSTWQRHVLGLLSRITSSYLTSLYNIDDWFMLHSRRSPPCIIRDMLVECGSLVYLVYPVCWFVLANDNQNAEVEAMYPCSRSCSIPHQCIG
jgi:hypothetical protein